MTLVKITGGSEWKDPKMRWTLHDIVYQIAFFSLIGLLTYSFFQHGETGLILFVLSLVIMVILGMVLLIYGIIQIGKHVNECIGGYRKIPLIYLKSYIMELSSNVQ